MLRFFFVCLFVNVLLFFSGPFAEACSRDEMEEDEVAESKVGEAESVANSNWSVFQSKVQKESREEAEKDSESPSKSFEEDERHETSKKMEEVFSLAFLSVAAN